MALIDFISLALLFALVLLAVPTLVVSLECVLGLVWPAWPTFPPRPSGKRAAVLVPAHNEELGISATLASLNQQLADGDRVLVVADNCSDRTAEVARACGAVVVERSDSTLRGKGYAVNFGLDALALDPPDILVMVDADCRVEEGAISTLIAAALETGRPVQADYLLTLPPNPDFRARISTFAFRVRNRFRPRGLARLGGPSHLAGSGMAFPWAVMRGAAPLGDDLAEDLLLGVEMSLAGHYPLHVPSAVVDSALASTARGHTTQRQRWEQGHLATLRASVPRLVGAGVRRKKAVLIWQALDLSVPPLTLHVLLLGLLCGASAALAYFASGSLAPLIVGALSFASLTLALGLVWFRHGRDVLPVVTLLKLPLYILWKIPLYLHMALLGGARGWVRTERAPDAEPGKDPKK